MSICSVVRLLISTRVASIAMFTCPSVTRFRPIFCLVSTAFRVVHTVAPALFSISWSGMIFALSSSLVCSYLIVLPFSLFRTCIPHGLAVNSLSGFAFTSFITVSFQLWKIDFQMLESILVATILMLCVDHSSMFVKSMFANVFILACSTLYQLVFALNVILLIQDTLTLFHVDRKHVIPRPPCSFGIFASSLDIGDGPLHMNSYRSDSILSIS